MTKSMTTVLSDSALSHYRRDGYYFPIRVYSPEQMLEFRRQLEFFEAKLGGPMHGKYRSKPHLIFKFLNEMIHHPPILDAVEAILGPNILCWNCNFFTKEANTEDYVSWHQDATYWGLSASDVVTAWIAFTPSTLANGAMRVIAGSHHEQLGHFDTFAENNLLSRGQEIEVDVDESRAVDLVLNPGEISLHHILIVHGSRPNPTNDRRIGFAIRYVPTYIKQIAGEADSATLVRGEDTYGHFELEPTPARDLDPAMIELHERLTTMQAKILYRGTDVMDGEASAEEAPRRKI